MARGVVQLSIGHGGVTGLLPIHVESLCLIVLEEVHGVFARQHSVSNDPVRQLGTAYILGTLFLGFLHLVKSVKLLEDGFTVRTEGPIERRVLAADAQQLTVLGLKHAFDRLGVDSHLDGDVSHKLLTVRHVCQVLLQHIKQDLGVSRTLGHKRSQVMLLAHRLDTRLSRRDAVA